MTTDSSAAEPAAAPVPATPEEGANGHAGRDGERTRLELLDAAERLFAERGFAGTTMEDVGRAAGRSRGAPGYFFGSKERLYRAVLARVVARAAERLGEIHERALAEPAPEGFLAALVDGYVDLLASDPSLVCLLQWEALAGGRFLADVDPAEKLRGPIRAIRRRVRANGRRDELLLAFFALCWFPIAHAGILRHPLGIDLRDPRALRRYKRAVVELLLARTAP